MRVFQLGIMIFCHGIADLGQIIIFVEQPNVQSRRAGSAMIAVHTSTGDILGVNVPRIE